MKWIVLVQARFEEPYVDSVHSTLASAEAKKLWCNSTSIGATAIVLEMPKKEEDDD